MNEENIKSGSIAYESGRGVEVRYVAYYDSLGFSNKILSDFDHTLEVYKDFGKSMTEFAVNEVPATMYSDAIQVTAMLLGKVLSAVHSLWFLALRNDLMIRGARRWNGGPQ